MEVCVIAGPGNGQEVIESLTGLPGAKGRSGKTAADLMSADVMVTPRGPSRSFSAWYLQDPLGKAVVEAYKQGTPWVALCGSGLPLVSACGSGCAGIDPQSLLAARGHNDRLFGQREVIAGTARMPFHFTSAPSFEASGATETLGTTDGEGSILRDGDLLLSSGLPLTHDGWMFLFEAIGYPLAGAKA